MVETALAVFHALPLLAGQFISPYTVYGFCREKRRHLLLLPDKTRNHTSERLLADPIQRIVHVNVFFQLV